jgi:hypothetical protein
MFLSNEIGGRVCAGFVDGALTGFWPVMGEGSANLSAKQSVKTRIGPKSTNVTHTLVGKQGFFRVHLLGCLAC